MPHAGSFAFLFTRMNTTAGNSIRKKRKQRQVITALSVVMMGVVLMIVLFLFRQTETEISRSVSFDPDSCVRLIDIGRVFRIRPREDNPRMLWFCTAAGLWRLDSETLEWTRFGLDHGLASETIVDITFFDGSPWVATWNGVARYMPERNRFEPLDFVPGIGASRILAIEFFEPDGLYFYIDGRGLYRIARPGAEPEQVMLPGIKSSARITCLRGVGDRLYIGVEGRRLVVASGGAYQERRFSREGSAKTLIWDVLWRNGRLWVATSNDGLWRAEFESDTLMPVEEFPAKGAYTLSPEPDGLWCGTPFGLWRYHDDGEVWIQFVHPEEKSPTDFQVFTLANTPERLWYGSMDLGAGFLRKERIDWQPMRAGLSMPNVAALCAGDSILWTGYGYQGGYFDRFDARRVQYDRNYNYVNGIIDPNIQSFASSGSRLYYGGYASFGYVDLDTREYRHYQKTPDLPYADIAAISCSGDTLVYLAGLYGLVLYAPAMEAFVTAPATEGMRVTAVREAGETVIFGTLGKGLHVLNKASGEITASYLPDARRIVNILGPDTSGAYWVAAKQSGLFRFDPAKRKVSPYRRDELKPGASGASSDYDVFAAHFADGYVWLGTRSKGCLILDVAAGAWHTLTYWEGLISDKVRSFDDSRRYVWVGCDGGVNRFDKQYLYRRLAKSDNAGGRGTEQ